MIEGYAGAEQQPADEMADLANAEISDNSGCAPFLPGVLALSLARRPARKAKASMASVICRYQPCQERLS
jgi:hypothetical protein